MSCSKNKNLNIVTLPHNLITNINKKVDKILLMAEGDTSNETIQSSKEHYWSWCELNNFDLKQRIDLNILLNYLSFQNSTELSLKERILGCYYIWVDQQEDITKVNTEKNPFKSRILHFWVKDFYTRAARREFISSENPKYGKFTQKLITTRIESEIFKSIWSIVNIEKSLNTWLNYIFVGHGLKNFNSMNISPSDTNLSLDNASAQSQNNSFAPILLSCLQPLQYSVSREGKPDCVINGLIICREENSLFNFPHSSALKDPVGAVAFWLHRLFDTPDVSDPISSSKHSKSNKFRKNIRWLFPETWCHLKLFNDENTEDDIPSSTCIPNIESLNDSDENSNSNRHLEDLVWALNGAGINCSMEKDTPKDISLTDATTHKIINSRKSFVYSEDVSDNAFVLNVVEKIFKDDLNNSTSITNKFRPTQWHDGVFIVDINESNSHEFYENEIDIKIPRLKYNPPSQLKGTVFPFVEEEISKVHSELSKLTFTGSSSLDDSKKSKQVDALLATLGFLKLLQNLRTVVFQNSLEIYHSIKIDEGELSCFYQEICGIFKLPFFTKECKKWIESQEFSKEAQYHSKKSRSYKIPSSINVTGANSNNHSVFESKNILSPSRKHFSMCSPKSMNQRRKPSISLSQQTPLFSAPSSTVGPPDIFPTILSPPVSNGKLLNQDEIIFFPLPVEDKENKLNVVRSPLVELQHIQPQEYGESDENDISTTTFIDFSECSPDSESFVEFGPKRESTSDLEKLIHQDYLPPVPTLSSSQHDIAFTDAISMCSTGDLILMTSNSEDQYGCNSLSTSFLHPELSNILDDGGGFMYDASTSNTTSLCLSQVEIDFLNNGINFGKPLDNFDNNILQNINTVTEDPPKLRQQPVDLILMSITKFSNNWYHFKPPPIPTSSSPGIEIHYTKFHPPRFEDSGGFISPTKILYGDTYFKSAKNVSPLKLEDFVSDEDVNDGKPAANFKPFTEKDRVYTLLPKIARLRTKKENQLRQSEQVVVKKLPPAAVFHPKKTSQSVINKSGYPSFINNATSSSEPTWNDILSRVRQPNLLSETYQPQPVKYYNTVYEIWTLWEHGERTFDETGGLVCYPPLRLLEEMFGRTGNSWRSSGITRQRWLRHSEIFDFIEKNLQEKVEMDDDDDEEDEYIKGINKSLKSTSSSSTTTASSSKRRKFNRLTDPESRKIIMLPKDQRTHFEETSIEEILEYLHERTNELGNGVSGLVNWLKEIRMGSSGVVKMKGVGRGNGRKKRRFS